MKAAPRSKLKSVVTRKKALAKKKPAAPKLTYGLVSFSFQDVDYQIDLERSKVYRRFIEVEKSRTNSIITAYRAIGSRLRPTL